MLDPQEGNNLRRRPGPRRATSRRCASGSRPGCGRPTTRCSTGPVAPPPGALVNEQWQVSPGRPAARGHGGSHGRSIQLTQVQPGVSPPNGSRAPPRLEPLSAAVVGAQVPDPAAIGGAKSSPSTESSRKKRMKMPWVTSSGRSPSPQLLELGLQPPDPAERLLEAFAAASSWA